MTVQQGARAPYATTGSIVTVVERHRQVGLRSLDLQKLQNVGVSGPLAPRTMQALILLDFYDEAGNVVPSFDALRKVPDHEFKPYLADLIRGAYAPIFEVLNLKTASGQDVENAFRGFEPTGQLRRMVQLFLGLAAYADLIDEPPKKSLPRKKPIRIVRSNKDSTTDTVTEPQAPVPTAPEPRPPDSASPSAHVILPDAGVVTLTANVNPLNLTKADRDALFQIVDAFTTWRESHTPASDEEQAVTYSRGKVSTP